MSVPRWVSELAAMLCCPLDRLPTPSRPRAARGAGAGAGADLAQGLRGVSQG